MTNIKKLIDYYWETNYYYATANGQLHTGGWIYAMDEYENMSWYYFGADAKAYRDTVCWIGDAYYGFDYSGRMHNDTVFSNYVEIDEKWNTYTFYAQDGGKLFTGGWVNLEKWGSSDWYYFNANGSMVQGWYEIDRARYYFGADGTAIIGWAEIDGKIYYFDDNCVMVKGTYTIEDVTYTFGEDGVLLVQ